MLTPKHEVVKLLDDKRKANDEKIKSIQVSFTSEVPTSFLTFEAYTTVKIW